MLLCSDPWFPIWEESSLYVGRLSPVAQGRGLSGVEGAQWGRAGPVLLWVTLTLNITRQRPILLVQPQALPLPTITPTPSHRTPLPPRPLSEGF